MHAVDGDRVDMDSFQATIAGVQTSLELNPSPENILVATGLTVGALQSYNRRTSMLMGAKSVELQAIVGMLTQTMSRIVIGSETSIARLQELQKDIEHAVMIEDVRTLKNRLSFCLESISGEVARQRDESSRAISELKQCLRESQPATPADPLAVAEALKNCDPVTGLLQRPEAEAAIAAACEDRSHMYAGLFVLDRIHSINARFGHPIGDKALVFFLQYLSQALTPTDRVFRWSDGSFLALMERSEAADHVRRDIGRSLARRTEQTFNIGDRSVVLPVSSTWVVAALFERGYRENLQKLDAFCESLRRT